jgi:WD40 repeat protein
LVKKFFLLSLLLFAGCAGNTPGKGPRDVFFAYGNGDGVYVISGDGSVNKKVIGGYYYQAVLSPDKTKLACVHDKDFQITIFDLDSNFESQTKPKMVFNSQAAVQGNQFSTVCCPAWSSDSQKLYFLNSNHLIVYDYQEKKTTSLFDFPEGQSGGQTYDQGNMQWSKDGDLFYCMLSEGAEKLSFWNISPGSSQGTPLAIVPRGFLTDFKFPLELSPDAVENLFGSIENPVLGPIHSSDHRYYFYFLKEQGFLAKQRIEGYDRTTKQKFDVVTLGTSIYSN